MSKKHLSPHDRYIRHIMSNSEVAREFLKTHLPEDVANAIDFSSLKAEKDSFIDDKLRLQVADLLYSANFNGEPGFLYVLLEHASNPDKLLPYRMLKYTLGIIDAHLKKTGGSKLPLVVPLILYSGSKPFNYSTDLFDLFGKEKELAQSVFLSPYQLIDLTKVPDEKLKEYFWFGAAALIAKHIHDPNILPILENVLKLLRKIEEAGHNDYIYVSLSYIAEAAEIPDEQIFMEKIRSNLTTIDEEKVMTLAEQWRKEGFTKGKLEGKLEGKFEGKREEKIEIARSMIANGLDLNIISSVTGLASEEIKKLMA